MKKLKKVLWFIIKGVQPFPGYLYKEEGRGFSMWIDYPLRREKTNDLFFEDRKQLSFSFLGGRIETNYMEGKDGSFNYFGKFVSPKKEATVLVSVINLPAEL